jgi:hypothetical protein
MQNRTKIKLMTVSQTTLPVISFTQLSWHLVALGDIRYILHILMNGVE